MFDNCTSLGFFCGTACSLSKLGLRSFSGPFDWYFSNNYSAVVSLVENRFSDFLKREHLEPCEDLQQFRDLEHDFYYLHDNDDREPFDVAYPKIYEKYQRRITTFLNAIEKPTCLFRTIGSDNEIDYINQNYEYIDNVFKSFNVNNEVVYILFNDLKELDEHCHQYILPVSNRPDREETMRVMFDSSDELLSYCSSLLSPERMNANLQYDMETKSYWWIS